MFGNGVSSSTKTSQVRNIFSISLSELTKSRPLASRTVTARFKQAPSMRAFTYKNRNAERQATRISLRLYSIHWLQNNWRVLDYTQKLSARNKLARAQSLSLLYKILNRKVSCECLHPLPQQTWAQLPHERVHLLNCSAHFARQYQWDQGSFHWGSQGWTRAYSLWIWGGYLQAFCQWKAVIHNTGDFLWSTFPINISLSDPRHRKEAFSSSSFCLFHHLNCFVPLPFLSYISFSSSVSL
jgi:hypothetical protein